MERLGNRGRMDNGLSWADQWDYQNPDPLPVSDKDKKKKDESKSKFGKLFGWMKDRRKKPEK